MTLAELATAVINAMDSAHRIGIDPQGVPVRVSHEDGAIFDVRGTYAQGYNKRIFVIECDD